MLLWRVRAFPGLSPLPTCVQKATVFDSDKNTPVKLDIKHGELCIYAGPLYPQRPFGFPIIWETRGTHMMFSPATMP